MAVHTHSYEMGNIYFCCGLYWFLFVVCAWIRVNNNKKAKKKKCRKTKWFFLKTGPINRFINNINTCYSVLPFFSGLKLFLAFIVSGTILLNVEKNSHKNIPSMASSFCCCFHFRRCFFVVVCCHTALPEQQQPNRFYICNWVTKLNDIPNKLILV